VSARLAQASERFRLKTDVPMKVTRGKQNPRRDSDAAVAAAANARRRNVRATAQRVAGSPSAILGMTGDNGSGR